VRKSRLFSTLLFMYGIIYCIENNINHKKYIGQTIRTLERRVGEHFSFSNKEYNKGRVLYLAITKYGKENFISYKIDEAESQEELDKKESFWIAKENTFLGLGYNMTAGGQAEKDSHSNQEIGDKLSEILGGKEFMIFDINGKYLRSTVSQTLFAREIGCCLPSVNNCLSGKKTMLKGYFLITTENFTEEKLKEIMDRYEKGRTVHNFVVFNENDDFLGEWENKKQCSKDIDIADSYLTKCLKDINYFNTANKNRVKKKYKCFYLENCPEYLYIKTNKNTGGITI